MRQLRRAQHLIPALGNAAFKSKIVNAASVHTDLSTCVLVIEFGPAAGAFRADLNLTADEQQRCIEIIEAAQAALDCLP